MTIRTRLLLAYTLLFGVVLSLFAAILYEAMEDERISTLNGRLESHAEKLHSEIEEQLDRHIFPVVGDLLEIRTRGLEGERFQLLDTTGTVLLRDSLLAGAPIDGSRASLAGQVGRKRFMIHGERYEVLWVPLEVDGLFTYVLEIGAPMTEIENQLARLRFFLIIAIPLSLLLTGLAGSMISRSAFRPVAGMIDTAKRITGANLKERIPEPAARDEIQLLAKTLNDMMERIDTAFESQKQFIADASHELRTPLTVIRSELEFAERTVKDPSAGESLSIAFTEIDRLSRMAEGLLMLAKMDASQFKVSKTRVRLDELLVECVQMMRTAAEHKRINLEVHIESAVELEADPARLKSVILNLLENAVKFSSESGVILCSLSLNGPDSAVVCVHDSGPGIEEKDLPGIFKRFYQSEAARSQGNGSGLGLAIVERIVSLHGGSVSVQSRPGDGTTFSIHLPLRTDSDR